MTPVSEKPGVAGLLALAKCQGCSLQEFAHGAKILIVSTTDNTKSLYSNRQIDHSSSRGRLIAREDGLECMDG
jgi:hypothetical protein